MFKGFQLCLQNEAALKKEELNAQLGITETSFGVLASLFIYPLSIKDIGVEIFSEEFLVQIHPDPAYLPQKQTILRKLRIMTQKAS